MNDPALGQNSERPFPALCDAKGEKDGSDR